VDLKNPNVSLCDPYCVGLIKQHLSGSKKSFYDPPSTKKFKDLVSHPCILNRFSLEEEETGLANFTLTQNDKMVKNNIFDKQFIDQFRMVPKGEEVIRVSFLFWNYFRF
jgi:hypothetical protein